MLCDPLSQVGGVGTRYGVVFAKWIAQRKKMRKRSACFQRQTENTLIHEVNLTRGVPSEYHALILYIRKRSKC